MSAAGSGAAGGGDAVQVVTPLVLRDWPLAEPGSSKAARGEVLVLGGTRGTPGAVRLGGEAALRAMGAPVRPADLGYDRQDTLDALRWAMEVRDRFTILRLCWLCGCLDRLVEEVVDEFCQ